MPEGEIVRQLCGAPCELLLEIYAMTQSERQTQIRLAELRRRLGSKVYANAYKLAMLGLVIVYDNKVVELTEYGVKIASCLYSCLHSTNHRREGMRLE